MRRRPKSLAPFSIWDTCRLGLGMALQSRALLMRLGMPAFVMAILTALVLTQVPDITPLRIFMFSLPLYALTAWFLGQACRYWVLGETPGQAVDAAPDRRLQLQATVISYILWKAAVAVYEQLFVQSADPALLMADPTGAQPTPSTQLMLMVTAGVLFWALRFRLIPVLTAVGYPLRDYAIRASSIGLSFRMLGLVMICVELPKALVIATALAAGAGTTVMLIVQHILTFALEIWLFAAFVVALRQMLAKGE